MKPAHCAAVIRHAQHVEIDRARDDSESDSLNLIHLRGVADEALGDFSRRTFPPNAISARRSARGAGRLRPRPRKPRSLILTARVDQAEMLAARVGAYLPGGREPRLWDTPESTPYEQLPFEHPAAAERVRILTSLTAGESPIIVASARNLMHLTIAPDDLAAMRRSFAVGDRVGSDELLAWAANMGYQRVPLVFEPGAIAQRGGVIDLFPPDADHPVRLDLFGDEIESIRQFDAQSQRSRAVLPGARPVATDRSAGFPAGGTAGGQLREIDDRALRAEVRAEWGALIDRIEHGHCRPESTWSRLRSAE